MAERPLEGRVALITGVSRRKGIGFGIANRMASMGAGLFVQFFPPYDSDPAALLEDLRALGGRVEHIEADFEQPDAAEQVVRAAVDAFGHVDILVANHAYSTNGALEDLTAESIDKHLTVNVRGSLLLVKEFAARHDDTRPGGRVILLTSGQHLGPMPGELAYIASKGALHQLTRSLAAHLMPREITVNTINPGPTDTGWATGDLYETIRQHFPQGRWGEPEDAARLIAWLCTDDARWITGQVINSDGGF